MATGAFEALNFWTTRQKLVGRAAMDEGDTPAFLVEELDSIAIATDSPLLKTRCAQLTQSKDEHNAAELA